MPASWRPLLCCTSCCFLIPLLPIYFLATVRPTRRALILTAVAVVGFVAVMTPAFVADLVLRGGASSGALGEHLLWRITHGELQGRRQAFDAFAFIRDRTPGFGDSYIVDLAPQVGIRETRRVLGEYQLSEDDVLDCVDFADTIGVNGWPVEAHVAGSVECRWPRGADPRGFNQLPYRMTVPRRVDNLFVAGRCASMTHGGQSSARVTGPCFAMGEAVGIAADLAIAGNLATRDVPVPELQRRLTAGGAFLGQSLEGMA